MRFFDHRHVSRSISAGHPLAGKTIYIPTMAEGSSEAFAAVFRWLGIDAQPTPPSDERTRELGAKYTSGDECYPAKVTVGDFLRVTELPGFRPARAAFFMPTAEGPCRFGQYAPFLKKVLRQAGYGDVQILSPSSKQGYADLGDITNAFLRAGWRALVAADCLHRLLLKTRPYETTPGTADRVFQVSLRICARAWKQVARIWTANFWPWSSRPSARARGFAVSPSVTIPATPLIGVVGEIFCRLNTFSNEDLVRKLESYGAECSLSHITEWVAYTNTEQERKLRLRGRVISLDMLKARLRSYIQHSDEHALMAPFHEDFAGYEEPEVEKVIELAWPYLPVCGALGEMVLSVGKAAYHALQGADGVIDISPFTCMNGIVSEAIYPKLSKDYGGIPIRNFYFDGTQSDLDRDLGIYLELARSYHDKKPYSRKPVPLQPVG